jgi:hypothetical protein
LNVLELEFPGEPPALGGAALPAVELQESPRSKLAFRKVLARIAEGISVLCQGFAMVQGAVLQARPQATPT